VKSLGYNEKCSEKEPESRSWKVIHLNKISLSEELESPMNIHRWRKLSGSDPSTFELITKIQTLQKRLIAKTEEVVEKELVIQQKEKLYKDIKDVLQRQPGPEVLEELRVVKEAVKVKVRESKVYLYL
jgi:hypothetical protein